MAKKNGILMQYFHWYTPNDGSLWKQVEQQAKRLADLGVTALWLPPAYKGEAGANSVGYDIYDLYDLGEFNQKGTVRTKYGTREEYQAAIEEAHKHGINIYADIVLNHKAGADETEHIQCQRVGWDDRNHEHGEPVWIDAWTKFDFPGRNGKYSTFKWNQQHFDGVDWAHNLQEKAVFLILGHGSQWERLSDTEKGNYDYLMFADLDFSNDEVRNELKTWGEWYINNLGVDGFRLDAIKHITFDFFKDWLTHLRKKTGKELFTVGEYWNPNDVNVLLNYLKRSGDAMHLFDAPLHHNLYYASKGSPAYDMRKIFDNSLVKIRPDRSVTLVDNHDTQPLQALEAPVENWFKPLAYAIILLREQGYPCIFYPDIYGVSYRDKGRDGNFYDIYLPAVNGIEELMLARKNYAYGVQRDYIDHWDTIGWTREGVEDMPNSGCAVIMSNSGEGYKWMEVGKQFAGKIFVDFTGNRSGKIEINSDGWGEFWCNGGSVSVWIAEQ